MQEFDHEKLDVYQAAIDFVVMADDVVEHLPRGRAYLADQLQRAATSIPLNVAEGAGEFSRQEKARFYRMLDARPPSARQSSMFAGAWRSSNKKAMAPFGSYCCVLCPC